MTLEEMLEKFTKELEKAQNVADPLEAVKVPTKIMKQMGQEVLVAACPKCRTIAGLDGPGKHLCRTCHTWLEYVREE